MLSIEERIEKFNYLEKTKKRVGNNKYKKYKELFSPYGFYRIKTIFNTMKQRCHNPNCSSYILYGAKGITVCDEWLNDCTKFYDWSYQNNYAMDLTIERIDNTKGYNPNNCIWIPKEQQNKNKRNKHIVEINGKQKTISEWCKEYNIKWTTFYQRIKYGYKNEELLKGRVR